MSITSSQKGKPANKSKHEDVQGVECQTEPIMVPFPLPQIGAVKAPKSTNVTSSQTEYTWMYNEFPQKHVCEPAEAKVAVVNASPKVSRKKVVEPVETIAEVVIATPEAAETSVDASLAIVPVEPEPTVATPSPKKRSPTKKKKVVVEEEVATVEPVSVPIETCPVETPKVVHMAPIMSDSSDDEATQLLKPVVLTRTITPQSIKPTAQVATPVTKPVIAAKRSPSCSSSSEDDNMPSSGESDAEIPAVSSIGSVSKKRKAVPSTPERKTRNTAALDRTPMAEPKSNTRLGPILQIDNVPKSRADDVLLAMYDFVPEAYRNNSIHDVQYDDKHSRMYFLLRITPKVVSFFHSKSIDLDGECLKIVTLNESEKKKCAVSFKKQSSPKKIKTVE